MAKRKSSSGARNPFMSILNSVPAEKKFVLPMVANSTTEVWEDIDTDINNGEAWVVYGVQWQFENVDPTIPVSWATGLNCYTLQLHRNQDNELLVNANDDDLMFEDVLMCRTTATAAGYDTADLTWPRKFGRRTVTLSEGLRVVFRTQADNTIISDATVQIAGRIFYDRIVAPDIGQSKIGMLANL